MRRTYSGQYTLLEVARKCKRGLEDSQKQKENKEAEMKTTIESIEDNNFEEDTVNTEADMNLERFKDNDELLV